MAKLTRAQRHQIESALYHLNRAANYIGKPDTAVCRRAVAATTTLHYTRTDGASLYEVDKDIGSDLCGLQDARKALQALLETIDS